MSISSMERECGDAFKVLAKEIRYESPLIEGMKARFDKRELEEKVKKKSGICFDRT